MFILVTVDPKHFPFSKKCKMKLFFKALKGLGSDQNFRRNGQSILLVFL